MWYLFICLPCPLCTQPRPTGINFLKNLPQLRFLAGYLEHWVMASIPQSLYLIWKVNKLDNPIFLTTCFQLNTTKFVIEQVFLSRCIMSWHTVFMMHVGNKLHDIGCTVYNWIWCKVYGSVWHSEYAMLFVLYDVYYVICRT